VLERFPYGVAGNFVKEDAVEFRLARIQQLVQVLADGLAFAIRVGSQVNGV
jgi:hypothetical protein